MNITHTPQGGPGDQIVLHRVVKNAAGDRVGTLNVVCEVVLDHKLLCNGIYRLPGGTITGTAQDIQSESSTAPVHIAITGGTGRYDQRQRADHLHAHRRHHLPSRSSTSTDGEAGCLRSPLLHRGGGRRRRCAGTFQPQHNILS